MALRNKEILLLLLLVAPGAAWAGGQSQPTMAISSATGQAVHVGDLFSLGAKPDVLVDQANTKFQLAPYSVVEFEPDGHLKLLRGAVLAESASGSQVKTSEADVEFRGRALVSHDHEARSTSAFVLEGQARMVNAADADRSLRLDRFHGATLEVGGELPQLIRQLDVSSLDSWLKGYAWPDENRQEILASVPPHMDVAKQAEPAHLRNVKLEDYFSSIDNGDDADQPDYYEKKYGDYDGGATAANAHKAAAKTLSPEEAALISLPSTKIDLGFDIIGPEKKAQELEHVLARSRKAARHREAGRALASVSRPKAEPAPAAAQAGDPDVNAVLARLRSIKQEPPVVSRWPEPGSRRGPASVGGVVPDPVYDYSENF
jgi:hypothetical protein